MMKSLSIKQRLIVLPLILVFSAVAGISILSWTALTDIAQIMRTKEMENNTRFVAGLFSSKQRNLLEISKIIARNGSLTESIYYYVKFGGERESVNKVLKDIYKRKPIDLMIVTDTDGLGLAYNKDLTRFNFQVSPELLGDIIEERNPGSIIKTVDGQLMIISTIPIYHNLDGTATFVGALINGHVINKKFLDSIKGTTEIDLASYYGGRVEASTSALLLNFVMNDELGNKIEHNDTITESFQPESGISLDISHIALRPKEGYSEVVGSIVIAVRSEYIAAIQRATTLKILAMSLFVVVGVGLIGWRTGQALVGRILELVGASHELSKGDMSIRIQNPGADEIGQLGAVFNEMIHRMGEDYWLKENTANFSAMVQKATSLGELSSSLISSLVPLLDGGAGLFFIFDEPSGKYQLNGNYCCQQLDQLSFAPGESLVGQCAKQNKVILLTEFPTDYIKIRSALGEGTPQEIMVIPVGFRDNVVAVIEIASFQSFSELSKVLIGEVVPIIGLGLGNLMRTQKAETFFIRNEFHEKE
jgi:sensor domain CHASE-containing protein/HAMP domain-containing protein